MELRVLLTHAAAILKYEFIRLLFFLHSDHQVSFCDVWVQVENVRREKSVLNFEHWIFTGSKILEFQVNRCLLFTWLMTSESTTWKLLIDFTKSNDHPVCGFIETIPLVLPRRHKLLLWHVDQQPIKRSDCLTNTEHKTLEWINTQGKHTCVIIILLIPVNSARLNGGADFRNTPSVLTLSSCRRLQTCSVCWQSSPWWHRKHTLMVPCNTDSHFYHVWGVFLSHVLEMSWSVEAPTLTVLQA